MFFEILSVSLIVIFFILGMKRGFMYEFFCCFKYILLMFLMNYSYNAIKFLFKLDKQGRGPEEYTYISDFDVSSDNKILTILTSGEKFLVYSITENGFAFRRSVSLPSRSSLMAVQLK